MGFGLSMYSFTGKTIDEYIPYDFMIESRGIINKISEDEVKDIIILNDGVPGKFSSLEFIDNESYRNYGNNFINVRSDNMLISETHFNKHMGTTIDVNPDELLLVFNQSDDYHESVNFDTVITIEPWRAGYIRADDFRDEPVDKDVFMESLHNVKVLEFEQKKTRSMYASFINSYGNVEFRGVVANVIDDRLYDKIQAERNTTYLFNLESGNGERIFAVILDVLREKNQADKSLWESAQTSFGVKDDAEFLRPIYKKERYNTAFKIIGFMFFSLAFLGILFLISSCVVLYFKIVSDIDEERDHISLLKKVGLTVKECRNYLQVHLAILFFSALVIGGIIGMFFSYAYLSFTMYAGYLMGRILIMYGLFTLMNILFYISLRRKFLRDVNL